MNTQANEKTTTALQPKADKKPLLGKLLLRRGLLALLAALILVLAVVLGVAFLRQARSLRVDSALYIRGDELVTGANWTLQAEDGMTTVAETGDDLLALGSPVYRQGQGGFSILLPADYALHCAGSKPAYSYQMSHFGTLRPTEGGILLEDDSGSVTVSGGLLYNGRDTYILLEPATLEADGMTIELDSLTTLIARHANSLVLYHPDTGLRSYGLTLGSTVALNFSQGRTLWVLEDRLILQNQAWMLLSGPTTALMELRDWKD